MACYLTCPNRVLVISLCTDTNDYNVRLNGFQFSTGQVGFGYDEYIFIGCEDDVETGQTDGAGDPNNIGACGGSNPTIISSNDIETNLIIGVNEIFVELVTDFGGTLPVTITVESWEVAGGSLINPIFIATPTPVDEGVGNFSYTFTYECPTTTTTTTTEPPFTSTTPYLTGGNTDYPNTSIPNTPPPTTSYTTTPSLSDCCAPPPNPPIINDPIIPDFTTLTIPPLIITPTPPTSLNPFTNQITTTVTTTIIPITTTTTIQFSTTTPLECVEFCKKLGY